jgi:hypothetical protein
MRQKLTGRTTGRSKAQSRPPHMKGFGVMRQRRAKTKKIQEFIDQEFSRIDAEDWK